ncbi:hypothetical protein Tco_0386854 [Tanacetum coccineum]
MVLLSNLITTLAVIRNGVPKMKIYEWLARESLMSVAAGLSSVSFMFFNAVADRYVSPFTLFFLPSGERNGFTFLVMGNLASSLINTFSGDLQVRERGGGRKERIGRGRRMEERKKVGRRGGVREKGGEDEEKDKSGEGEKGERRKEEGGKRVGREEEERVGKGEGGGEEKERREEGRGKEKGKKMESRGERDRRKSREKRS